MKKISALISAAFLLTAFVSKVNTKSLLPKNYELEHMLAVNAIGIDTCDDGFRLTLAYTEPDEQAGVSTLTALGATFSDAVNNASAYAGRSIYLGHSQIVIIGKTAAQKGLTEITDYIVRSCETRLSACVVTAENYAEELLNVKPVSGADVLSEIETLIKNTSQNSLAYKVTLAEMTADMLDEYRYPVTPLISTAYNANGEPVGNILVGCAVYKEDRLFCFIENSNAYIFTLLKNRANSHVTVCDTKNAGRVTLQINSSQIEYTFKLDEKTDLTADLLCDMRVTVVESSSGGFDTAAADELTKLLGEYYVDEITRFLNAYRDSGEDIIHIADKLRRFHHVVFLQWSGFSKTRFNVKVHITVENSTIYGGG